MGWWLDIAWAVNVEALGTEVAAPGWSVAAGGLASGDVSVAITAAEVVCSPVGVSPGWVPAQWGTSGPGKICRDASFGSVTLQIAGPEIIAGARAKDLQQLLRGIELVLDRAPRVEVTLPVSYGATLFDATPVPIFLVNIPVPQGIVRWEGLGSSLSRVAPVGFAPVVLDLGASDQHCAEILVGREATTVADVPAGWVAVAGPEGTTVLCRDSGAIARLVRVRGADEPERWRSVVPVLDAFAHGEANPQQPKPDTSGDVSGLFVSAAVPADPTAFAGARGWGTLGTASTVIPWDADWLAITTRLELGMATPFAFAYGLRVTVGPGHQWGPVGVALTGGAGIDGIGIQTLPIALQAPVVMSVVVDLSHVAVLVHGDLLFNVATSPSRRHGSSSVALADELVVGAGVVVGRGGHVGGKEPALGVYVEGLYHELMNTRTLGVRVGLGSHTTK